MVVHLFRRKDGGGAARSVAPTVAPDERIYAIGDVHGRYDLLIPLLKRLHDDARLFSDQRRPRFVFLGDVIDRGEESRLVLDALSALTADPTDDMVLLLGNHEAALLAFLRDPVAGAAWLEFGGLQTLASLRISAPRSWTDPAEKIRVRDALGARLAPYASLFERFRLYLRSGDVVFCHAGLDPGKPVDAQDETALTWGHPRFLVDTPVPDVRIVHGHFDAADPVSRPGRICVDTGAYYSGVLTAVRLDAGEAFLSVRAGSNGA